MYNLKNSPIIFKDFKIFQVINKILIKTKIFCSDKNKLLGSIKWRYQEIDKKKN